MTNLLERCNTTVTTKHLFGIIAGARLSGKTTLVGTLPGRTLLLQAIIRESGSESATALAEKLGNKLHVMNFGNIDELMGVLRELRKDEYFDNIVVDSLSAITDMKYDDPKMKALIKVDNWAAFRQIGEAASDVIITLKELTYAEKVTKPKHAWLTCALSIKQDKAGEIVDVSVDCKGNIAASAIIKFGEAVITVLPPVTTANGESSYRLLTKSQDVWPGRIDGILREDNPGIIEPASLRTVLKLKGF